MPYFEEIQIISLSYFDFLKISFLSKHADVDLKARLLIPKLLKYRNEREKENFLKFKSSGLNLVFIFHCYFFSC